jgi:hypothetical protein
MNAVEIIPAGHSFETHAFITGLIRGFFRKAPHRAAGCSRQDTRSYVIALDSEELGRFMIAANTRANNEGCWTEVPFSLVVG